MLNVERRYMIKEWYQMGWSISEIARYSGHDRKTVRKILAEPLLPTPAPRKALYAFVMTLGWSRTMYLEFTTSTDEAA